MAPGPRMGPRPHDFDEELIRKSPTFIKWSKLEHGQRIRYACRDFVKGQHQDEERLMRRIMIARRNNLRDHSVLKQARKIHSVLAPPEETSYAQPMASVSDEVVRQEMDVEAVERTRSYRSWSALADGQEFVYNQKYTKGRSGHDWLLKKNIWRRMRYRRENKKRVEALRTGGLMAAGAIEAAVAAAVCQQSSVTDDTTAAALEAAQLAFEHEDISAIKYEDCYNECDV